MERSQTFNSGRITFLFTDVVDSTRYWDENPGLATGAMVRHDRVVENLVRETNGRVVRPRGEGDSRFIVFEHPAAAARAAVDIQTSLASESWRLSTPLEIRISIHTGTGNYRDGDYYGSDVNRCARIRSLAHGGQILVSAITKELIGTDLPEGTYFTDLGHQVLKGLRDPEHIYQLSIPGLRKQYPPLKVGESLFDDPPIEQQVQFCTASDGVTLAYGITGEGPPLVKSANWLNHLEYDWHSPMWRHWLMALSEKHRLVRYDERGSGLSDWEADDLSFDSWVKDLETVVDAAGLERFPLIGISQGGAVSIAYTFRHPERVSRLLLYGGYVRGWRLNGQPEEIIQMREALITIARIGWGQDNPAFRQVISSRFMPEATSDQMDWFNELQKNTTSPGNAVKLMKITGDIDVSAMAAKIRVPTLVLHARDDEAVPFQQGELTASLIPGARFIPLESKNHILLADEPAWMDFVVETDKFLTSGQEISS